jgi:hypothetical protein
MNNKGSLALAFVAVILALVVLSVFLVNLAMRDCNSNRDCASNAYCGSDNECHYYPDKIVVKENNFLPAALVITIGLIVASYINKKRSH